jgi:hypothetical protein
MLLHAPSSSTSLGPFNMSHERIPFGYRAPALSSLISIPRASAKLLAHPIRDSRFELLGQMDLQSISALNAAIRVFDLVRMFLPVPVN